MAASGLAGVAEAAALEMAVDCKSPRVHLLQLNAIFSGAFDKSNTCSGTDIANCLERLNGVIPAAATIKPYLKSTTLAQKFGGFNFGRNTSYFSRLGRSPSTDSIAASNFSCDQGSVDSCPYSSNGSDSNSGSFPCSPEEPDRYSRAGTPQPMPPIPPSLQEDTRSEEEHFYTKQSDSQQEPCARTDIACLCDESERVFSSVDLVDKTETSDIKPFYLQNDCSVPNSAFESFQRTKFQDSVLSSSQSGDGSDSSRSGTLGEHSRQQTVFIRKGFRSSAPSSNSTDQSNRSSTELQQCNWLQCKSSLEGNAELVEHIRTQHVQSQKDKESFICLWEGCKVFNRASCSLSWLERHILSHAGSKPFKCIVDNCCQRFRTQAALQRHVNSHFESHGQSGKTNKCKDETFPKSFRRKKHLKYKKRSSHGNESRFSFFLFLFILKLVNWKKYNF